MFKLQFHDQGPQWMQREAITDYAFRQNDYQTVLKFWAVSVASLFLMKFLLYSVAPYIRVGIIYV